MSTALPLCTRGCTTYIICFKGFSCLLFDYLKTIIYDHLVTENINDCTYGLFSCLVLTSTCALAEPLRLLKTLKIICAFPGRALPLPFFLYFVRFDVQAVRKMAAIGLIHTL